MIDGQLSIFDYMDDESKVKFHPTIDELSVDVHKLFDKCEIRNEEYTVWQHVPNLGKRYCAWIDIKDKGLVMNLSFAPLIEKYKRKSLEVSFVSSGSLKDDYSHSLMVSSIWETKGHKEPKGD